MIYIILLVFVTYIRSLFNGHISDDVTAYHSLKKDGFPIKWKEVLTTPSNLLSNILWKICKDNKVLNHFINIVLFALLSLSFYFVGCKYLPKDIMFLATLIFVVHPCNAQIGGWISGKWYGVAVLVGLWALYFNNIGLYILTMVFSCNTILLPLIMNVSIPAKVLSIFLAGMLILRAIQEKNKTAISEGWYKKDNLKIYPRKLIVALKSFVYYFTFAMFPIKMGWFHEIGEPIDDNLKSFNFHTILCVLLLMTFSLFIGTKAFIGLLLFCLFIAPFTNIITPGLFTSERYMLPAMMGFSIFLSSLTVNYPIIATVIICLYFMRTQLELWAYQDDFHLAIYSLLNFHKSGFAWCNLASYFLQVNKPFAAYDVLKETTSIVPEFPTTYYQLYLINRAKDLCDNFDEALKYLEKACYYGKHENWYKELEDFKFRLKQERIGKFKQNVARTSAIKQFIPRGEASIPDIEPALVGISA